MDDYKFGYVEGSGNPLSVEILCRGGDGHMSEPKQGIFQGCGAEGKEKSAVSSEGRVKSKSKCLFRWDAVNGGTRFGQSSFGE